jgi:GNAT superfamily N-acetyltransferase
MIRIESVQSGPALDHVITLSMEYVAWMMAQIPHYYPDMDLNAFTAEHDYDDVRRKFPGEHVAPDGCLLLALDGDAACGCIAVGRLSDTVCEMRTLFVRPSYRGKGVGRMLVDASFMAAREFGYSVMRLDTLPFMTSALQMYRALGFYDIPPYRELSPDLQRIICFLELKLVDADG